MNSLNFLLFIIITIFSISCTQESASVVKYDTNIKEVKCLALVSSPLEIKLNNTLLELYGFDKGCEYKLHASQKSGIVCNSNQNVQRKALSNFPVNYLRLDIYKESKLLYSYYNDLDAPLTQEDVQKAFRRVSSDIGLE